MDRLERDWSAPPYDSLAESVVLWGLLMRPAEIKHYDVRSLLVYPEHGWCLDAMVAAESATRGQTWADFYLEWGKELERQHPGCGYALEALLDHTVMFDEARARESDPYSHRDWTWWLERLKRVAEARRGIHVLQEAVDCLWRVDIDGAASAAAQMPRPATIRIEV